MKRMTPLALNEINYNNNTVGFSEEIIIMNRRKFTDSALQRFARTVSELWNYLCHRGRPEQETMLYFSQKINIYKRETESNIIKNIG